MSISSKLKEARTNAKMSQNEMAEKLGLTVRTYGSYERGERDVSTALLVKICKALKVSADWLLEEDEEDDDIKFNDDLDVLELFGLTDNTPKISKPKDDDVKEYFETKEKAPADNDKSKEKFDIFVVYKEKSPTNDSEGKEIKEMIEDLKDLSDSDRSKVYEYVSLLHTKSKVNK